MQKYFSFVLLCFIYNSSVFAQTNITAKTVVKIKIIEGDTKHITPAMVCITKSGSNQVHLPPLGEVEKDVSNLDAFFKGVEFDTAKNWVGPVRMTNGRGNNKDRSGIYGVTPSIPYWKAPVMYQTSGDFSIELPIGVWKINIEHGNEYLPIDEEIIIKKSNTTLTKTFVLKRWINMPDLGWYSGDVHVHHPTNKPGFREYLLEMAKSEDLHLVNILEMGDHAGVTFKQQGFGQKFRVNKGKYWLVSGQEDPRSRFGHISGLNIDRMVRDTTVYDYYDIVLRSLKMQPGAVVGFAHFSWFPLNDQNAKSGFPWLITTGQIDYVELLQFSLLNDLDYYDYLNLGFRIVAAAGSDFPWGSTIGEVRTMVYTGNNFTPNKWFSALKAGHTFVTNGPALFLTADGKLPGTEIFKSSGSSIKIAVKALSRSKIGTIKRVAIYNNKGLVSEALNVYNKDSIVINLDHKLKYSQWISAVVICENGAVAHTTPVYVVVDGKPTYDIDKGPEIIEKQIQSIQVLNKKDSAVTPVDHGLIERYNTAIKFYQILLSEMTKDKQERDNK
ncbi:MAG: CehA/McbA family metallohydrolase [Ginsengibacter sp.]